MRSDYQVLIIPYTFNQNILEVAIFKRSNGEFWQFISGGGEDDESYLESAKRESYEEAGINATNEFIKLDSITTIAKSNYKEHRNRKDIYVIPEYSFCVKLDSKELMISDEHLEYKWVNYENGYKLLKFDSNKTALWELREKIIDGLIK